VLLGLVARVASCCKIEYFAVCVRLFILVVQTAQELTGSKSRITPAV